MILKVSKRIYFYMGFIWSLVIAFALLVLLKGSGSYKMSVIIPVVIANVIIAAIIAFRYEKKHLAIIKGYFSDDCRPEISIAEYDKQIGGRLNRREKLYARVHKSTPMYYCGSWRECAGLLEAVPFNINNIRDIQITMVSLNNSLLCYVMLGETEKAEECMEKLSVLVSGKVMQKDSSRAFLENTEKWISAKRHVLNIEHGSFGGEQAFFENMKEKSESNIEKVHNSHYLSKIHMHDKNYEKALECVNFIIEKGGTSFYVGLAKEAKEYIARHGTGATVSPQEENV